MCVERRRPLYTSTNTHTGLLPPRAPLTLLALLTHERSEIFGRKPTITELWRSLCAAEEDASLWPYFVEPHTL